MICPSKHSSPLKMDFLCALILDTKWEMSRHGVVAEVPDCDIVVSKFELQSRYYVHFRTVTLEKGMKPLIPPPPPNYGLNSITTVLQGWFWHEITHGGWYAITQGNKTKYKLKIKSKLTCWITSYWQRNYVVIKIFLSQQDFSSHHIFSKTYFLYFFP